MLYNIESITNLYIDTEGHDVAILNNFDMTSMKPINIYFENRHTDGPDYRGEKYDLLIERYRNYGYRVISENNDTHIRLDI